MPFLGFDFRAVFVMVAVGMVCGCGSEEEIRTYAAPAEKLYTTADIADQYTPLPEYKVPKSWEEADLDEFSAAAYNTGSGQETTRVTVTQTAGGANFSDQLNRWRRQLGLPPLEEGQLMDEIEIIKMGEVPAAFVQFDGQADSIAGALATTKDGMWFFKMRGSTSTVRKELKRMKSFCLSVRFDST